MFSKKTKCKPCDISESLYSINPGQCATGGYFFILFTWTRVEGDSSQPGSAILNPGQQFSTRADTYNIPSNALEPSVFFRAKVRIMADNNHYNVDAMNAEEKRRKVIVSASAVLILLLAIIQMHGVVYMLIIQQQQQIAAAQNMLMLDTMKSIRMLKQLKRRIIRRRRRRWVNPGRTDRWWKNLWAGEMLEEEWNLNLRMSREHFMELVEMVRPHIEIKAGNFRSDVLRGCLPKNHLVNFASKINFPQTLTTKTLHQAYDKNKFRLV